MGEQGPLTTSQLLLLLQGIFMNCSVFNHVYWKDYKNLAVYGMFFLCMMMIDVVE